MNYDLVYDKGHWRWLHHSGCVPCKCEGCINLRPVAQETETSGASDPRSERGVPTPPNKDRATDSDEPSRTSRHASPSVATKSTTSDATCSAGGAPVVSAR